MSIDIYFAGSRTKTGEQYLLDNGCNRLLSFLNDKSAIKTWLSYNRAGKLFIDSGAFSAWTKGAELDVDNYISFLNQNHENITIYAQVDVIPGQRGRAPTASEVRDASAKSWENYQYMRELLIEPDKLIYAFHAGEPEEYLIQALKCKIPYIALGGLVGRNTDTKYDFLESCFKLINEYNPEVKVHIFGITTFNILEKFNVTSADSTTHIQAGCNGNIICNYGTVCLSDRKSFTPGEYLLMTPQYADKIEKEVNRFGFTVEELKTSHDKRILFNVMFMKDKADKLEVVKYRRSKKLF
jgi:hypothetical protein